MNKKLKTMLLSFGTISATIIPVAAVISCSNAKEENYATSWAKESRRDVFVFYKEQSGEQPYIGKDYQFFPGTRNASGKSFAEANNSYSIGYFRPEVVGFPKYNKQGQLISGKESEVFYKFEAVKSLKVNFKDGTSKIFDKDTNDRNDESSINGNLFKNLKEQKNLEKIESIEFGINDQLEWVSNKTGQVARKLNEDDFWKTIQYKRNTSGYRTRYKNSKGLSESESEDLISKIDTYFNNTYSTGFKERQSAIPQSPFDSNGYFGINYGIENDFSISQKVKTINNGKIKFSFSQDSEFIQKFTFFNEVLKTGFLGVVSSSNLDASNETELFNKVSAYVAKENKEDINLVKEKINKLDAWNSGFYVLYSKKWNEYYSAGQYFLKNVSNKEITYSKNNNYFNKKWVDDKGTIENYTYIFGEDDEKNSALYQGYLNGQYVFANYLSLPDNIKSTISKEPAKFGIYFTKPKTSQNQVQRSFNAFNFIPFQSAKNKPKQFLFNDGFSKVMFGVGLKDLLKGQAPNWVEYSLSGPGASFRSSILAAINWYSITNDFTNSITQEWLSFLAPEQTLDGKINAIDNPDIYSNYALGIDENTKKITVTTKSTHQDLKDVASKTKDENVRFLTKKEKLSIIKDNIKKALDEAQIGSKEKVMFELPISYYPYSKKILAGFEMVRKQIESLDSRLKVVASMNPIVLHSADEFKDKNVKELEEIAKDKGITLITSPTTIKIKDLVEDLVEKLNDQVDVQGLKNAEKDYQKSYVLNDGSTWTLIGKNSTDEEKVKSAIISRLTFNELVSSYGINIWNSDFQGVDSLAKPLLYSLGYLQSGKLMMLSYYQGNKGKIPIDFEALEKLTNFVNDVFAKMKNKISEDELKELVLDPAKINATDYQIVVKGIKGLDFDQIWKSNIKDLNDYDYLGFKGNSDWDNMVTFLNDPNNTELKSATNAFINSYLNGIIQFEAIEFFKTLNLKEKVQITKAFDTFIGSTLFFAENYIGNRENLTPGLKKTWYKTNSSPVKELYLGSFRVEN